MLVSSNPNFISVLALAAAVSSAPLNERSNGNRGIVGWLCHYDGPSSAGVEASLDLPTMLGGLCAKVNYDYAGCESFDPTPKQTVPVQSPQDDGNVIQSTSLDHPKNHGHAGHEEPKPKKNDNHHQPKPSAPVSHDENASAPNHKPHQHKESQHKGNDGDANPVNAHSFSDFGDDQPKSPDHSHVPKPHSSSSNANIDPSAGSASEHENVDGDTNGCNENERYSSQVNRCVDKSFFSPPQTGETCQKGLFDAVVKLCVDVSTLGMTDPIHGEASVLQSGRASPLQAGRASALQSGRPGSSNSKCPLGQQYSSLLSVCVENSFFSTPLSDHQCENGWKLDLVLGNCLDLVGCQNHSHQS